MSVLDKIYDGEYENRFPAFQKIPIDEDTMTVTQAKSHEAAERQRVTEWNKKRREHNYGIRDKFRKDLEEEFETGEKSYSDKLWEIAWCRGHAEGFENVYYKYDELARLIKLVK
jgi:hypothetical protein